MQREGVYLNTDNDDMVSLSCKTVLLKLSWTVPIFNHSNSGASANNGRMMKRLQLDDFQQTFLFMVIQIQTCTLDNKEPKRFVLRNYQIPCADYDL